MFSPSDVSAFHRYFYRGFTILKALKINKIEPILLYYIFSRTDSRNSILLPEYGS